MLSHLDDHARAGFFDVASVAVLQAGLGRNIGLDVDNRRADEFGDELDDVRLGLQRFGLVFQLASEFGPLFGIGVGGAFERGRQRRRLRRRIGGR